jgi:hypothetical protein
MRRARLLPWALVVAAAGSAACSAVLGLDAPPEQDAGVKPDATSPIDASPDGDDADASADSAPADTATTPPVCAALDAGAVDGATYGPLDDITAWELFDTHSLPGFTGSAYLGGTFDGRFVYFAGRGTRVMRYDTQGAGLTDATAWSAFQVGPIGAGGGFAGAAFDGRFVYFVPYQNASTTESIAARLDTQGAFNSAGSWATFDLATLSSDGGAAASGFFGAVFDGRYLYFVPRNDGAPDGRVVRYDTSAALEAGAPVDAGDGGPPSPFDDPTEWTTFDVSSTNPTATGFAGGVFTGSALYLVPNANDAFDSGVHNGGSGIAARYAVGSGLDVSSSWSTFDMTMVNGLAEFDWGGAFDGKYVYFIPHAQAIVTRVDTSMSFTSAASWSAYDTTQIATADGGGAPTYSGGAFDGRFIYAVPGSGSTILRYDTTSTFVADCAWSSFDLNRIASIDGGVSQYSGAIFDGEYVYLVPFNGGLVARFDARSAGALPSLPAFHGSFL